MTLTFVLLNKVWKLLRSIKCGFEYKIFRKIYIFFVHLRKDINEDKVLITKN